MKSGKKKFFKSDLREKNLEPSTAADWLRIIEFIQKDFPRIEITEHGNTMIIEVEQENEPGSKSRTNLA